MSGSQHPSQEASDRAHVQVCDAGTTTHSYGYMHVRVSGLRVSVGGRVGYLLLVCSSGGGFATQCHSLRIAVRVKSLRTDYLHGQRQTAWRLALLHSLSPTGAITTGRHRPGHPCTPLYRPISATLTTRHKKRIASLRTIWQRSETHFATSLVSHDCPHRTSKVFALHMARPRKQLHCDADLRIFHQKRRRVRASALAPVSRCCIGPYLTASSAFWQKVPLIQLHTRTGLSECDTP